MTEIETFSCPECGGPLTTDGKSLTVRCPFCGSSVVVPDSLRSKPATPAPAPSIPQPAPYPPPPDWAASIHPPTAAAKPRRASSVLGCLVLAGVLLAMAGIGALSELRSGGNRSSLSAVSALLPTPTFPAFQRDLQASLPRQVNYGGIVYTLTKAVIDNQDTNGEDTVNRKDAAFARLYFDLQNVTKENIYMDSAWFKLRLADGKDYALDSRTILNNSFTAPGPQSTGATTLIFQVPPEAGWQGSTLTISSPDGEPAVIPMSGEMPKGAYQLQVSLPSQAEAPAQGLDYTVTGAALDLDSGSHRADKGKRFLILQVKISNSTAKYGANVSSSNFRLIVDSTPYEPQAAPIEVIDYSSQLEGEVVFLIPDSVKQAILQVGEVTSDQGDFGRIPLDLSQASPAP